MSANRNFALGTLVALQGGDSDVLITSGDRIATLGGGRATWWIDGAPRSLAIPGVQVRGARWSDDGAAILVGPGRIDVRSGTWTPDAPVLALLPRAAPGEGGVTLRCASWSGDGRRVALLIGWTGPSRSARPPDRVVVLDGGKRRGELAITDASHVLLSGEHVLVAAEIVRIVTIDGALVASLPTSRGAALRVKTGARGALLVDLDGGVRVVDVAHGRVRASWSGSFTDVAELPGRDVLVAIDGASRLHGACIEGDEVREVGIASTNVRDARLALTSDGHVVLAGAGPVPVHTATLRVDCSC